MRSNLFKLAQAAVLATAMAFTLSCSSGDDDNGDSGSCSDGTVKIGKQCWQKQNSNLVPRSGSGIYKCYEDKDSNCDEYGKLYDWEAAQSACPSGFHLPTDEEWTVLTDYVGGASIAGTKLKSKTGWESYSGVPVGTDEYGFAALPGGYGGSDGVFLSAGSRGVWWSATEFKAGRAYFRNMDYDDESVSKNGNSENILFSVRCLQD